ncbi:MAG: NADH-quinone oxidoreductase subunit A [Thermoleophilia bacterium]|nr:NADH-quinone oxidoreductase subunit A [Thermoleophilia bacterium]
MNEPYQSDVLFLLGFTLAVFALPVLTILAFRWLRPSHPGRLKGEPYESGVPQASIPRRPFHMAYYNFALVFIVFEVETLLLFAIAPVLRDLGWVALGEVAAFVGLVALGLFYAWRRGALVWR